MKLEVFILGGQRVDYERRDSGKARGNEEIEKEKTEKGRRERIEIEIKEKRQKCVEMTC